MKTLLCDEELNKIFSDSFMLSSSTSLFFSNQCSWVNHYCWSNGIGWLACCNLCERTDHCWKTAYRRNAASPLEKSGNLIWYGEWSPCYLLYCVVHRILEWNWNKLKNKAVSDMGVVFMTSVAIRRVMYKNLYVVQVSMGNMRVAFNRSTKWVFVESCSNQWSSPKILQHQFTRTLNGKMYWSWSYSNNRMGFDRSFDRLTGFT